MPAARYIRFADVSALRARWDAGIYIRVLSATFATGEHIAFSACRKYIAFAPQIYRAPEAHIA